MNDKSQNIQSSILLEFKQGITRAKFIEKFNNTDLPSTLQKHCLNSYLAESNGILKLILFIESYMDSDILEIFNADYLPKLESLFGKGCITNISTLTLNTNSENINIKIRFRCIVFSVAGIICNIY